MTAQEIIEKIRAEIEHRRDLNYKYHIKQGFGSSAGQRYDEDVKILSILSALENSEKPINQYEDFRGEMREWVELMVAASFPEQDNDFISEKDYRSVIKQTASHFAKWGAEHAREQMMKEAVEGKIGELGFHNAVYMQESKWTNFLDGFKKGDKVRIIIVKED